MRYTGPKVRLSRQVGAPLTPKAQKVMEKKGYPPGMHGRYQQFRRKESDYKRQLLEKQRLRYNYNVHEKQLRNYYKKASRMLGNRVDNLMALLETRLDAVILRAGFARTIYGARQVVTHGHIEVNGKRLNIPSYNVQLGDMVTVREKSRKIEGFTYALDTMPAPPEYLERSPEDMSIRLINLPKRDEIPIECEVSLVIEFYSR